MENRDLKDIQTAALLVRNLANEMPAISRLVPEGCKEIKEAVSTAAEAVSLIHVLMNRRMEQEARDIARQRQSES